MEDVVRWRLKKFLAGVARPISGLSVVPLPETEPERDLLLVMAGIERAMKAGIEASFCLDW